MNDDDESIEESIETGLNELHRMLLDSIMSALPEITIRTVDEENKTISELVITNTMPECVVCGTTDVDQAFQDPRFMDGQTLCEFCYVPRIIEWERTNT